MNDNDHYGDNDDHCSKRDIKYEIKAAFMGSRKTCLKSYSSKQI